MNIRPENQAYLWPSPAQSRHSERSANGPVDLCSKRALWRSSRSLLWVAGWRICPACPTLRKDLCKPEDKERYIPNSSELRSERFYFCIEGLSRLIGSTVVKVVQDCLIVIHERLNYSFEVLRSHCPDFVVPPCQVMQPLPTARALNG
jgi:hypothetical protein